MIISRLKRIISRLLLKVIARWPCLAILLALAKLLPAANITDKEPHPRLVLLYGKAMSILRHALNNRSAKDRQAVSDTYLIPVANILFDKNYVNMAQLTLLALEEYFLSKKTEKEFEAVLATFSPHAIAAGERFREKFPLSPSPVRSDGKKSVGFVAHFVAISGYEVVLGLGKFFKNFSTRMYALRAFDSAVGETVQDAFARSGMALVLPEKRMDGAAQEYDVFALRRIMMDHPVDIAIWPLPPFHMFFLFSFGLAGKQVWFSQYLRPDLRFKYLDRCLTPGGAGKIGKKMFNGKEWDIIPQVAYIAGISAEKPKENAVYLFTPARLEKLKQPEFMGCVAEILKRAPDTHFKWTGYYRDREVVSFFEEHGLGDRHTYLPWLEHDNLLREIKETDLILSCFPLSLGTVEYMAAHYNVPIVSMYDAECNLYWRDIYWEATNGNEDLKKLCCDEQGHSRILIIRTAEEYIQAALRLLEDKALAATYADIYRTSYDYAYHNNQNDVEHMLEHFFDGLYPSNTQNT